MHADSTLTVENVSSVMSCVQPEHRLSVWEIMIPDSRCEAIMREYHDEESQNIAFAHFYVHCYLDPSWEKLAKQLYDYDDPTLPALKKIRQSLPPIGVF